VYPLPTTEVKPGIFFSRLKRDDDSSDFDCGHKDTNEFLKDDAIEYQNESLATTYVLKDDSNKVIGFVKKTIGQRLYSVHLTGTDDCVSNIFR